jgi:hypothetical protein
MELVVQAPKLLSTELPPPAARAASCSQKPIGVTQGSQRNPGKVLWKIKFTAKNSPCSDSHYRKHLDSDYCRPARRSHADIQRGHPALE